MVVSSDFLVIGCLADGTLSGGSMLGQLALEFCEDGVVLH